MSKKAKFSKPDTKKEPAKEAKIVKTVYETKAITEDNICWAIKEIGTEASVNAIRKHLGQPVFLQLIPKPIWAADQIRAILAKSTKVLKANTKSVTYTLAE